MKSKNAKPVTLPIILLLLSILAGAGSCRDQGNFRFVAKHNRGPGLQPAQFWSGELTGHRIIRDRSSNVLATARIELNCNATDDTKGSCRQLIHYSNDKKEERDFTWQISYSDSGHMSVTTTEANEKLSGQAGGAVILLSGEGRLPLENEKSSTIDRKIIALHGEKPLFWEEADYSFFGFLIGKTTTLWQK